MKPSTSLRASCPKCRGCLVPDHSYDVPAEHCFNCGYLILGERTVTMPGIPSVGSQLATDPHDVYCREYHRRAKESVPHRKTTSALYREANS